MKILLAIGLLIMGCSQTQKADLIIINGDYYSGLVHDSIEAIAVVGDKIYKTGKRTEILALEGTDTKIIDAQGQFVMPGFIEGHGHFPNFGTSLQNLNFLRDTSWADIVAKVENKIATVQPGEWIYGRGWHQEKWTETPEDHFGDYPLHDALSAVSPDNPVVLYHASGHSLFANAKAIEMAGINKETPQPKGGMIIKDLENHPIGVFEERAMTPISKLYREYLESLNAEEQKNKWIEAFDLAQNECIRYGITSFQDAGLDYKNLKLFEEMAETDKMKIRFWVMIREKAAELSSDKIKKHRKIGWANNHYTCRAIKSEIDGALGAHGAWLLEPYKDKPDFYGQNTTDIEDVETIADLCFENQMQLCVHAIGDRANKETLDIIESHNSHSEEPLRWRVEHAQHLHPSDIERFHDTGAIASMQGVHCTSDAPFVQKRLGYMRAKIGAYAWRALLAKNVIIVNGTDVPVESINPFENYHASVTRTRTDNGLEFFVEQRMSREEALKSYTIDAAYGAFEEELKGTLEPGKLADIVVLDTNLLTCEDDDILNCKVNYTIIGGEIVYTQP